jgi:predicted dehydrogenase
VAAEGVTRPVPALRFGLVGTGDWARTTHAPALASTDGVEFVAVWGRNPAAAAALAGEYGAAGFADLTKFLGAVEAVAFAVPPDVQSTIAMQAASAGKHLLLEKPIATDEAAADALVGAVEASGVASVVFFTARFLPDVRAWLDEIRGQDGWAGGSAAWLGTDRGWAQRSPWRHAKGGLWDLGPHVVSLLWECLGPVVAVTADFGQADVVHLVLHHDSGVTSTTTLTLTAPPAAAGFDLCIWGASGRVAIPATQWPATEALRVALRELADNATAGRSHHACDVWYGRDIGRVLAMAERKLAVSR